MLKNRGFIAGTLLIGTALFLGNMVYTPPAHTQSKTVTRQVGKGTLDWTYGTIKVTGMGAPPNQGIPAQKKLMARRAAVVDGYRQLAEIVNGVQVTSETVVKNFVTESDVIKTQVRAVIKGAQVKNYRDNSDGLVEADVTMPVYGDKSLAWALDFGNFVEKESDKELNMKPSNKPYFFTKIALLPFRTDIPFADNYQLSAANDYTGLIVNASGLGVEPAMCPFIIGGAKRVYPSNKIELDPDTIVKEGVTHYVTDLDEAKKDSQRVGANPLIIEAKGVKPGCDLILAQEGISKIMDENKKSKFLESLNVAIVID